MFKLTCITMFLLQLWTVQGCHFSGLLSNFSFFHTPLKRICHFVLRVMCNPPVLSLQMIPLDSFMAHSADGKLVPVVPGGHNISLTFSNKSDYVERALDYRLHEMDRQVVLLYTAVSSLCCVCPGCCDGSSWSEVCLVVVYL